VYTNSSAAVNRRCTTRAGSLWCTLRAAERRAPVLIELSSSPRPPLSRPLPPSPALSLPPSALSLSLLSLAGGNREEAGPPVHRAGEKQDRPHARQRAHQSRQNGCSGASQAHRPPVGNHPTTRRPQTRSRTHPSTQRSRKTSRGVACRFSKCEKGRVKMCRWLCDIWFSGLHALWCRRLLQASGYSCIIRGS
jgi:hypothetical protein